MMSYISSVEQLAAQLRDLESPVTETQMMAKILMPLPSSYRHFISAWDSVSAAEKTMTCLTLRLLKEKKMGKMHGQNETNFYSSCR